MEVKILKRIALQTVTLCAAVGWGFVLVGCDNTGLYSKVKPEYDLAANQDKKILLWVEAPRSAAADVDAAEKLAAALVEHLVARAKVKPENVLVQADSRVNPVGNVLTPESVARQEGAGLVLIVRIEEYELFPMNIRDYHFGHMMTRSLLLDVETNKHLWPKNGLGKVHDVAIELGQGNRTVVLSRMAASSAHCILRDLYPIVKSYYKNSDERISMQEAFEMETF